MEWVVALAQSAAERDPDKLREIVERFRERVEYAEQNHPVTRRSFFMILLK